MNASSEPIRIGSGSTMLAIPASQQPWMIVISCREVGPRIATWSPGHQTASLQRGADDPGFVVNFAPGNERLSGRRSHGGSDESHAGGPVGGGDDPLDDAHVRQPDASET